MMARLAWDNDDVIITSVGGMSRALSTVLVASRVLSPITNYAHPFFIDLYVFSPFHCPPCLFLLLLLFIIETDD